METLPGLLCQSEQAHQFPVAQQHPPPENNKFPVHRSTTKIQTLLLSKGAIETPLKPVVAPRWDFSQP